MTTATILQQSHKNKAFTTLLAFLLGMLGAHRFYLHGSKDRCTWPPCPPPCCCASCFPRPTGFTRYCR